MSNCSRFLFALPDRAVTEPATPSISGRKQPRQARSNAVVAAILQAGAQVLAREGAARFTTARVAERAGISIGSLYQYFPNKAAILFRLQSEEWGETRALLDALLGDATRTPSDRLRAAVTAFVDSECAEAAMRQALEDAAPFYRDAPEARVAREQQHHAVIAFMAEAAPGLTASERADAAAVMTATLKTLGKAISLAVEGPEVRTARTTALADMLCAYLAELAQR